MKTLSKELEQLTISTVDGVRMVIWNDVERLIHKHRIHRLWLNLALGFVGVVVFGYLLLTTYRNY